MSTADPSDVDPGVISTNLEDSTIQGYLDDATAGAETTIPDYDEWESSRKRRLEKYYAALLIREFRDRPVSSASRETASVTYEGASLESLRKMVDRLDPSGELTSRKNTDRYVGST